VKIESHPAHVAAATTPLNWKQGFAEDFADFPVAYRRVGQKRFMNPGAFAGAMRPLPASV
jgi:hypothetical protein